MRVGFLRLAISIILSSFTPPIWAQLPAPTLPQTTAPAPMPATAPPPASAANPISKNPDNTQAPAAGSRLLLPPKNPPATPAPTVKAPTIPPATVNPEARMTQTRNPAPVRSSVQKFADGLAILLLNLGAYNDPTPEQKNRLNIALNSLKVLAPEVQPQIANSSTDPVLRYVSWDLSKQFLRMEAAVNAGTFPYARYLLRQIIQYCMGYHAAGKAPSILPFPEAPNTLGELDKAEYYAAIKRYEESMLAYERVLSDKQFKNSRPDLWLKAVENLMAITIRVRNDAHITLEMSSALLEEGGSTQQKEMLQAWRTSAKAWTTEGIGQKTSGPDLLIKAQQFLDKGTQLSSKGPSFGTIEYMRAISLLIELAQSKEHETLKSKGFQLMGKTSEKMRNVFLWMHPDAYYEACIRSRPHSVESRECLKLMDAFQYQQKDVILDREKVKQLAELAK